MSRGPSPYPDSARLEAECAAFTQDSNSILSTLADPKHTWSSEDMKPFVHALKQTLLDVAEMIGTPVDDAVSQSEEAKPEEKSNLHEQPKALLTGAFRVCRFMRQHVMTSIQGGQACTAEEIKSFGELQDVTADIVFTSTLGIMRRLVQSCATGKLS